MTDVRSFFEKKYIGAWDIPEGKDVVLVIDHCEGGKVANRSESKKAPLLFFSNVKNKSKPMVLNVTNAKTIVDLYGKHIEKWPGKPIAIFATTTPMAGEVVDCIRIRPSEPPMPKGAAAQAMFNEREPGEEATA